ncbi:MAG: rod shape-determining protein [Gemmatimonadota bacterium]
MADIAIDLGTTNTLIHVRGKGVVLDEPSVVAIDRATGEVVAVGLEARRMIGRTPAGIEAVRPMRGGAISDVDRVDIMLRHFLSRVHPKRSFRRRPTVLITAPSGITEMERRALRAGIIAAGAGHVSMIAQPIAAAVGAGLPIATPRASMVVNVGGGTTEIGVIALSGIVAASSLRVAGQDLDEVIVSFVRRHHNLLIGEATAESIKLRIGSAFPGDDGETVAVKGRDLLTGVPTTIHVSAGEIRECIREQVQAIAAAVRSALQVTPPELAGDIIDDGIVLTGGGAQLRGLSCLLGQDTQLAIRLDDDPTTTVVRGAGEVLEHMPLYREAVVA